MGTHGYEHELEMAKLTAENHGNAHDILRAGYLIDAIYSLRMEIGRNHRDIHAVDRDRIVLEVLYRWQCIFASPDYDE